jgi:hypothetical protein
MMFKQHDEITLGAGDNQLSQSSVQQKMQEFQKMT